MKKHIPNVLSAIRLCCVPVFIWLIMQGEYAALDPYRIGAAGVFFFACCTDVLDGTLARRNQWITPLGKVLDPIADKTMQFAVLLSLMLTSEGATKIISLIVLVLFVIKEGLMVLGGIVVLRVCKDLVVSVWYGKFATTVFFAITMTMILIPDNFLLSLFLCVALVATLLFALLMYFFKVFRGHYGMHYFKKAETAPGEEQSPQ